MDKQKFTCQQCGLKVELETVFNYEVCPKCNGNLFPEDYVEKMITKELAAVKVNEIIASILSDHDSKYYLDCKYLRWGLIEKEIIDIINKIWDGDQ